MMLLFLKGGEKNPHHPSISFASVGSHRNSVFVALKSVCCCCGVFSLLQISLATRTTTLLFPSLGLQINSEFFSAILSHKEKTQDFVLNQFPQL
jgi:hypothetical protein